MMSAYRTVSAKEALFFAGTPLGDLHALERKRVRNKINDLDRMGSKDEIREEERDILLATWSIRWTDGRNASWMHKILPDLIRRVRRRPKDLTFHVMQAITRHWSFRDCLDLMDHAHNADCLYYQHPLDTVEKLFFTFPTGNLCGW